MSSQHERQNAEARDERPSGASLEITEEAMRELSGAVVQLVTEYFGQVRERRVFPDTSAERVESALAGPLPLQGEPLEKLLEDCRTIIESSRHNGHPRFYGYVASPSTPAGAYADLLASALNQNVTSWRSAPAATTVEKQVVRWLGQCIGLGESAQGLLTSGGSMANLNALFIAHRSRAGAQASRKGLWKADAPMTAYASDQVHSSIEKAADILGLGREQVRLVETDADYRLDVRALRERLESDRRAGLRPFCLVGNAGTVTTGVVDPLAEMAALAAEQDLWFHVDGAYGAPGSLDQEKRALFRGLERADSVALDAHKWLYAPVDCGCLLLKDGERARRAFAVAEVDYISVHEKTEDESFAFWDYGVELSRRFRALKVWMMLRYYGVERVAASIAEDNRLAQYMAEQVNASDDLELLAPVALSVCCFRYVPREVRDELAAADDERRAVLDQRLNQLNTNIMHRVQRGGRAYLSNVTLRGRFALRACITNFHTTRADILRTLETVREVALRTEG
jgi:glutamate/tyrosine decarboxylase-like PLP-dependent enzyme